MLVGEELSFLCKVSPKACVLFLHGNNVQLKIPGKSSAREWEVDAENCFHTGSGPHPVCLALENRRVSVVLIFMHGRTHIRIRSPRFKNL